MEKLNPTYNLDKFKASNYAITNTAMRSAAALGLDKRGIRDVVLSMQPSQFYKSMTSYADHRIWQDVYHVPFNGTTLYVKFTKDVIAEFLLLSLKEK